MSKPLFLLLRVKPEGTDTTVLQRFFLTFDISSMSRNFTSNYRDALIDSVPLPYLTKLYSHFICLMSKAAVYPRVCHGTLSYRGSTKWHLCNPLDRVTDPLAFIYPRAKADPNTTVEICGLFYSEMSGYRYHAASVFVSLSWQLQEMKGQLTNLVIIFHCIFNEIWYANEVQIRISSYNEYATVQRKYTEMVHLQ